MSRSGRWNCVPYRKPGAIKMLSCSWKEPLAAPGLPQRSWLATLSCGTQRAPYEKSELWAYTVQLAASNSHNPPHTDMSIIQGCFGKKKKKKELKSWIYQTLEGKKMPWESQQVQQTKFIPLELQIINQSQKETWKYIHLLKLWES